MAPTGPYGPHVFATLRIIYMIKNGTWSPEGIARPTDQSVAQAIRALSPLRAGGSAGVWFDNTML